MARFKFDSPGVTAQDVGSSIPTLSYATSVPAMVIGTSIKGPAFVPTSFGSYPSFINTFGDPFVSGSTLFHQEGKATTYGPLAVQEWMRNSTSVSFIRVLGIGDGKRRITLGQSAGDVSGAGFTVGEQQPDYTSFSGSLKLNPFANYGGVLGRTYFLGCFMSESIGSTIFSSAGLQGKDSNNGITGETSVPIIRGILMAPSGVVLRLSSSGGSIDSSAPGSSLIGSDYSAHGTTLGSVKLFDSSTGQHLQQFVMLLNGHKGIDSPNVITASMDLQSPYYITKVFNMTASLIQEKGHYLAAFWDLHPSTAILTGTGVVSAGAELPSDSTREYSTERSVFLLTSSLPRDVGSMTVPNYESFRDRFTHSSTPWVISQKFHGNPINLFKLHSLDDGSGVSEKYKIIIHDITPSEKDFSYRYGTFSLSIRNIDDFDEITPSLESHINLSLNPSSDRYICKIIGDTNVYFDFDRPDDSQKVIVEGNYPSKSKYVRVEVSNDVINQLIPHEALPIGFRGISHIITSGSSPLANIGGQDSLALMNSSFLKNSVIPPLPLTNNIAETSKEASSQYALTKNHWGVKFDHIENLTKQNDYSSFNQSFKSITRHFPNNSTANINFSVSDNSGAPDTSSLGIIDSDRFCNNFFTLENIKIVTGSNGYSTNKDWASAEYVRDGNIQTNDADKTRRLTINDFYDTTSRNFLSFQLIMQGGFDGVNIFEFNERNLTNAAVRSDMYDVNRGRRSGASIAAYLKSLDIINNVAGFDMQLLAIPGIRVPEVTDEAINVVETRFDSMYVMDIEQVDKDQNHIDISMSLPYDDNLKPDVEKTVDLFAARSLNTSFAASYFPDVTISLNNLLYGINEVQVPPSVAVLGALSLNDTIGQSWLSPAGINRGALNSTLSAVVKLKEEQLNLLYKNDINPIYAPSNVAGQRSGVLIWGQKTLNRSMSTLERINVRRLLLEIRRLIRDIAIRLLFESNREDVISRFSNAAGEKLSNIKENFGLRDFKVRIDASTTTQADIDNHTIRGRIYIQPTRILEYMSLDFIVSNGLESEI